MRIWTKRHGWTAFRRSAFALGFVVFPGCSRRQADESVTEKGPPVPIDTSALAAARAYRAILDSADKDTSAKADQKEFLKLVRLSRLVDVQETLARLGYGNAISGELDKSTENAIRAFDKRHGLPENDDPEDPTFRAAVEYVDKVTSPNVGLQGFSMWTSSWSSPTGAVRAAGTWSPAAPPRQTSEIWCYRHDQTCHESLAFLGNGALQVGSVDYQIERWDEDQIVARFTATCVSEVLTINRASESAVLLRNARGGGLKVCAVPNKTLSNQVERLTDGNAVADSLMLLGLPYMRMGPRASATVRRLIEMRKSDSSSLTH